MPITWVLPNAAGNLARGFGKELAKRLGQAVIVENQGGASGALAAQRVLRANPDGYTLRFGTTSDMAVTPMPGAARPGSGMNTLDELVALAKQKPNGISVGTTGNAPLQAFAAVAL